MDSSGKNTLVTMIGGITSFPKPSMEYGPSPFSGSFEAQIAQSLDNLEVSYGPPDPWTPGVSH